MERIKSNETRTRELGNGVRVVLPPSHGNVSMLPLPLPESLWPTVWVEPHGESSVSPAAMFVPRVSVRSLIVAAALALTFIGCARSTLEAGDPLAGATEPTTQNEDGAYGPVAGSGSDADGSEDGVTAVEGGAATVNEAARDQVFEADDEGEVAPTVPAFVRVVAGTYSTCGIHHDGSVECWGMACSEPSEDGSVKCWGRTCADGACRTFGMGGAALPGYELAGPPKGTFADLDDDGGMENWCALDGEGNLACWGSAYEGKAQAWPMGSKLLDVASVGSKKCGIALDGSLSCASSDATDATAMGNAYTSLSASSTQMCALREDGTAECWGQGMTPPATQFTDLEVGSFHACGLRDDGEVMCWGAGTTSTGCNEWELECGQAMAPTGEFVSVTTGLAHSCGLRRDGSIECWGAGTEDDDCDTTMAQSTHMQCGQAKAPEGRFVDVSAGAYHTCAVDTHGKIVCWGLGHERGACGGTDGVDAMGTDCGQAAPPR